MKCPYCSHDNTQVIETRDTENLEATRRRRECLKCEKRFTTYETIEMTDIRIVKKDGKRERFDTQKLYNGVIKSCEKLPIASEDVKKLVQEVEAEIRKKGNLEVDSKTVGLHVMRKLRKLNKIAYIRFAAVYREFDDLDNFKKQLSDLMEKIK